MAQDAAAPAAPDSIAVGGPLGELRVLVHATQAELAPLLDRILEAKHDDRLRADAGRAIDELARARRYRALGHRSLQALLVTLGVSRTTAHRWRQLAAQAAPPGPRRRRPREVHPAHRAEAEAAADALRDRLARQGVSSRVEPVVHRGRLVVQVSLSVADAARIG